MIKDLPIEIFGQRYTIKGNADIDYVNSLAKFVDEKMKEIASLSKDNTPSKLAILTALNITHELFQERVQQKQKDSTVEKRTKDIIERIEEHFDDLKFY